MKRRIFLVSICILVAVFLIGLGIWGLVSSHASEDVTYVAGIPRMKIYLKDVTLDEIRVGGKSTKYEGNEIEIDDNGETKFFGDVEIKGRGNSTWGLPKLPFQIKLNEKTDLFGLGAAKKWVLLANYLDVTNLRNDVAFKLSDMLGEKYVPNGEFVELSINDEDVGLYYITHKIEIKKESVDLRDQYGILMEEDNLHRKTEECIDTDAGVCLVLKDAVMEDDEEELAVATEMFMDAYNQFEVAVRSGDWDKITELADVKSFARYYLVSEFTVNPDAYCSSLYLYKDGETDKIHIGPVWDFDYALGNKNWIWGIDDSVYSPFETMVLRGSNWKKGAENGTFLEMYYLMELPEFRDEVRRLFREKMSGNGEELMRWVRERRDYIRDAAILNAEKWEIGNFDEETDYLIDWIEKRYGYFERVYGREEFAR